VHRVCLCVVVALRSVMAPRVLVRMQSVCRPASGQDCQSLASIRMSIVPSACVQASACISCSQAKGMCAHAYMSLHIHDPWKLVRYTMHTCLHPSDTDMLTYRSRCAACTICTWVHFCNKSQYERFVRVFCLHTDAMNRLMLVCAHVDVCSYTALSALMFAYGNAWCIHDI
jgi:hypothetical protein